MNEREAYIALNLMEGVGPVGVGALIDGLGSAASIFEASGVAMGACEGVGAELVRKILDQRDRMDPGAEEGRAAALGLRIIVRHDPEYPAALGTIHDPPLVLYVRGEFQARDQHALAVVGTRRATHYGKAMAEKLAYELASAGYIIVSGLARGIDTAAHQGALRAGGRTCAVLGSAFDKLYPTENTGLAAEIAGSGVVLSEFPIGTQPSKTTFPVRNRIVSGLSRAVLVVEAGARSGAMITARVALDQGRSVLAVPGRADSRGSKGPHQLIKQGAPLVECAEDVLEEFDGLFGGRCAPGARAGMMRTGPARVLSAEERRIVDVLEAEREMDVDALGRAVQLRASDMNVVLLGLEMKRVVRMLPGRVVQIVEGTA